MAAGFTDYLIGNLLNHCFASGTFTKPTGLTLHLYKGDPHSGGVEVSAVVDDTAYASQSITFENEGTTTNNRCYNTNTITFPAVVYGSGAAAYSVLYAVVKDGSANVLDGGPLPASVLRSVGEPLVFAPYSVFVAIARS